MARGVVNWLGSRRKGISVTTDEVWVLGATGRTGRAVAAGLQDAGLRLVLVGRDAARLAAVADELGGAPRLVVGSLDFALAELTTSGEGAPRVVVNTVGPFTTTAPQVAAACPPGTHYVDVANELAAVESILALDAQAAVDRQVFVTGAGFGVLATESVVLRLCADRPPPARVRVDAIASVAVEAGLLGDALAGTIAEILAGGGRQVRDGHLVHAPLAHEPERLTTPDGEAVTTVTGPSGDLFAAWRASRADSVLAASSAAPASPVVRLLLPAVAALLRAPAVRGFAVRRLGRVRLRPQDRPRPFSWAHARVEWADGTVREGWLRAGDGMTFTVAVMVAVTRRLVAGGGRPGAHTPGALFGPELAEEAGAELLVKPGSGAPES